MPVVETTVEVPVSPMVAYAVSQTTGEVRLRWDPFIRRQHFLDGAQEPGRGVRTRTVHRSGVVMTSEYVSWSPPSNVGMRMVDGPFFLANFAGGWRFAPATDENRERCLATWRYSFRVKPDWLSTIGDRIGLAILGWEMRRRIEGFAAGCRDEVVVAEARRLADRWSRGA